MVTRVIPLVFNKLSCYRCYRVTVVYLSNTGFSICHIHIHVFFFTIHFFVIENYGNIFTRPSTFPGAESLL